MLAPLDRENLSTTLGNMCSVGDLPSAQVPCGFRGVRLGAVDPKVVGALLGVPKRNDGHGQHATITRIVAA